jgi:hypothetical protein
MEGRTGNEKGGNEFKLRCEKRGHTSKQAVLRAPAYVVCYQLRRLREKRTKETNIVWLRCHIVALPPLSNSQSSAKKCLYGQERSLIKQSKARKVPKAKQQQVNKGIRNVEKKK